MFELHNAVEWTTRFFARPIARGWLMVAFVCIAMSLVGTGLALRHATKLEHTTCTIQSHGLPASRDTVTIFDDIHGLLVLPQTPAQLRLQRQLEPPAELAHQQWIVADLNKALNRYSAHVHRQPYTRTCQS